MSSDINLEFKKYPYLNYSHNFIENFTIMGFNKIQKKKIYEDILKIINGKEENSLKEINKFHSNYKPIIINSISSDFNGKNMINCNLLLEYSFPNYLNIYYIYIKEKTREKEELFKKYIENESYNIIFFTNSNIEINNIKIKNPFNNFVNVFYERTKFEILEIYFPKAFLISTQNLNFMKYNEIFNKINQLFISDGLEIPLEILIYNLVNFVPSTINYSFKLNLFPENDLYTYNKRVRNNTLEENEFLNPDIIQLSAHPFCDFGLIEIFKFITIDDFIKLFFYTFIEKTVIIISDDIKKLSMIMYIILILSYPFTESDYFNQIIVINKDSIKTNPIIDKPFSYMLGINGTLEENIIKNLFIIYPNISIIFDLDNHSFYFKPEDTDDSFSFEEKELNKYLDNILSGKKTENLSFFEENIKLIKMHLQKLYDKIELNQTSELNDIINFFDKKKKDIANNRIKVQEPFYIFQTNIFSMFRKAFKFEKKKEDKKDIKINNYCLSYDEERLNFFSKEENYFMNDFKNNNKYKIFIEFLKSFEHKSQLYKIPYIFVEYFIFLRFNDRSDYINRYFEIMDCLYFQFPKIKEFNFDNFYKFYYDNLKDYFYKEIKTSKKITNTAKITDKKLTLKYNKIELDNKILLAYSNYIENLSKEELDKIFPSIDCEIKNINYYDILIELMKKFINLKKINYMNFIALTGIIILGYFSDKFDISNKIIFFLNLLKNDGKIEKEENKNSEKQLFCAREYIGILISIICRLCLKENASINYKMMSFKNYEALMDFIIENEILPNENILKMSKQFQNIEFEVKKYEKENNVNENVNNIWNDNNKDKNYKIFLKYNFCKDGIKNEEFYIQLSQRTDQQLKIGKYCDECLPKVKTIYDNCKKCKSLNYSIENICSKCESKIYSIMGKCNKCHLNFKPLIYNCELCKRLISAKIFLKKNSNKKKYTAYIYVPRVIFSLCDDLMKDYYLNLEKCDSNEIKEKINICIINLIFYCDNIDAFKKIDVINFLLELLD